MEKAEIIQGRGYDLRLSNNQKKAVVFGCGLISTVLWLFFSTPNTIDLSVELTRSIAVLGIAGSGVVLGVVVGLFFISIGELVFMYLSVWKSWWFLLGLAVCAAYSIVATTRFEGKSIEVANIKHSEITIQESIIQDYENQILESEKYSQNIENEIAARTNRGEQVPGWLYFRKRKTKEELANLRNNLIDEKNKLTSTKKENGPILTMGTLGKNQLTWGHRINAVLVELGIILFGVLAIGMKVYPEPESDKSELYNSRTTPNNFGLGSDMSKLSDVPGVTFGQTEAIGFKFSDKSEKKSEHSEPDKSERSPNGVRIIKNDVRVNSVQKILHEWDDNKIRNKSEIARRVPCSEKYVRVVLNKKGRA